MPLSSERVQNNPLTGPEIKDFVCHLLRKAMNAEWAFNEGTAYPRVGISIEAKFHFVAASMPKTTARVRVEPPLEAAPLREVEGDEGVIAFTIEKTVDNPNLERVHAGIPIPVTTKSGAAPGKMFPTVETHLVTYDPKDYPEAEPPKQTDISAEAAREWNVKVAEVPMVEPPAVEAEPEPAPRPMGLRKKRTPKVAHIEAE